MNQHPNRTSTRFVILGLVMVIGGLGLLNYWGGVEDLQAAASSSEFANIAADAGNNVRKASWVDILVFVPGYSLLLGGLLAKLRTTATGIRRRVATAGLGLVAVGALIDQIENLMIQLGMGTVDLDLAEASQLLNPNTAIINILQIAFVGKFIALVPALIATIGLGIARISTRRAASTTL